MRAIITGLAGIVLASSASAQALADGTTTPKPIPVQEVPERRYFKREEPYTLTFPEGQKVEPSKTRNNFLGSQYRTSDGYDSRTRLKLTRGAAS